MKKHLLTLAAVAMMAPAFSAFALEGEGTEANPYKISTVADLEELANIDPTTYHWYILENDIDMTGVTWTPPYTKTVGCIHFDGNKHVIKNLTSSVAYASLFGQFDGSIKNLGLEGINCVAAGQWDPAGAFAAYAGNVEEATIEGCYAIGKVGGYYAGGIIGGTKVGATIRNCYASVNTSSTTYAGGLCACVNYITGDEGGTNKLTVEYAYADGMVESASYAGGILGANQTYAHPALAKEVLEMNNVVAMNVSVKGTNAGAFTFLDATYPIEIVSEDAYLFADMTVNDQAIGTEDGISYSDCMAKIAAWPAFALDANEIPVLKWQLDPSAGISDIAVDNDADAPAVYYNLQGVRIANPEAGIFIVRKGNKVTKQIIK